ncbi:MAG: carboxypeptidase regulatory-like domain-containing protein [Acidobacteria bacterium]|nr:carboxypeptidase regulatory-like domain-containing protein [Acidobacteriota bacterium]
MTTRKLLGSATILALVLLAACGGAEKPAEVAEKPAAEAPAGPPVDPATAATVTGKVVYKDGKPQPNRIRMDADAACAAMHGTPVFSHEVVVNDNGTLRYVFVYVKEGLDNRTFPTPKEPAVLDQRGCLYTPHVVGVQTNQDVKILNSDSTTHNIHPVPTNNREWNTSMPPGAEPLVKNFPREELLIPVKCNVHPWMKSYIGVLKHPFFAVTGIDGTFTLKGLPPGEYTIAAWQEKFGAVEQKVTVGPKETKTVDFTITPKAAGD